MAALEKELGLPLFVRTRSDWHLTPAGEIYVNTARQILNLKKDAYSQIQDLKESGEKSVSSVFIIRIHSSQIHRFHS